MVKRLQAPDAETLDKAMMAGSTLLSTAFRRLYSWFHRWSSGRMAVVLSSDRGE